MHVEMCVGSISLPQSTFGHFAPLILRFGGARFGKEISARVAMCGLGPQLCNGIRLGGQRRDRPGYPEEKAGWWQCN